MTLLLKVIHIIIALRFYIWEISTPIGINHKHTLERYWNFQHSKSQLIDSYLYKKSHLPQIESVSNID